MAPDSIQRCIWVREVRMTLRDLYKQMGMRRSLKIASASSKLFFPFPLSFFPLFLAGCRVSFTTFTKNLRICIWLVKLSGLVNLTVSCQRRRLFISQKFHHSSSTLAMHMVKNPDAAKRLAWVKQKTKVPGGLGCGPCMSLPCFCLRGACAEIVRMFACGIFAASTGTRRARVGAREARRLWGNIKY